jgi:hypothetical protein
MSFLSTFQARPSQRAAIPLLVALLALTSCNGPKDEQYNPRHFHVSGAMLPAGIIGPTLGIYAEQVGKGGVGDRIGPVPECCVVAQDAQFRVMKAPAQTVLHMWVHVLDETHVVAISFPGFGGKNRPRHLEAGYDDVSVSVPRNLKRAHGRISVRLDCVETNRASQDECVVTSVYFE